MQLPLPLNLRHQPAFFVNYYDVDGPYAGNSDCHFLSVGLAQYNRNKISGKTLRNNGTRWKRNSEEMPVHRVLDLASVIALASAYQTGDVAGTLQGASNASVELTNPTLGANVANQLRTDPDVQNRLHALAELLRDLGYGKA